MIIKQSLPEHTEQIVELYYQLHPELSRGSFGVNDFKAESKVFVATEGDKVLGFVWVNFYSYARETVGYVDELIVREVFRKKGIGSQLVRFAIDFLKAQNSTSIFVSVSLEDKDVLDFYQKQGFELCKGYWLYKV